jgi:hypothetical protein
VERRREVGGNVPDRLVQFVASDWGDEAKRWDGFRAWKAARLEWVKACNEWPGGLPALFSQEYRMVQDSPQRYLPPDEPFDPYNDPAFMGGRGDRR